MSKKFSKKSKQPAVAGEGKTWLHSPEAFTQGAVVYSLKLLGLTDVPKAKGTEVVREAITKVKFANHLKKSEAGIKASKLRKVDLKISVDTVKIDDTKTKEELYSYPLHRISYCADDKRDKKLFAFIAKDKDSPQHFCYVLESDRLAEELTLTVGQAFDIAYRKFLERRGQKDVNAQKQMTVMQDQIKAAEAEKEALKQKIAQLELGTKEPNEQVMAENNVNVFQSPEEKVNNSDFSLLGDFSGGFASQPAAPPPPPQNPSDGIFDPLAEFAASSEPQAPPPQQPTNPGLDFLAEFTASAAPQPAARTPPPERSNPFMAQTGTGEEAPAVPKPQPVAKPRRNVPTSPAPSFGLPPPPTKQSVKASQRQAKIASSVAPPVSNNPASQPPASTDLLSLDTSGSSSANPFASASSGTNSDPFDNTDPFANIFDPLEAKPQSNLNNGNGFQDMQEGFARGLVIDHNVFTTTDA